MDILPARIRRFPKLAALGVAIATASLFIVSSIGTAGAALAPTNVVATPSGTSVSVSFTPDPGDLPGATTYTANCTSTDAGAPASASAPSPITVTGLTRGKTYSCKVTASDANGTSESVASNTFTVPTVAPSAPTVGQVTANGTTASVPYTGSVDDGGAPPLTYTAACSSTGGATGSGSGASPIAVTGLSRGRTYTCTVTAHNANGQTAASAPSNSFTIATTAPSAPTIGTVTLGGTTASVPYTPSADDGGATVSYSASCTTAAPGATGTGSGGSPISVPGLTPAFSYTCTVTASNGTGSATSGPSNSVTVAPPAPTIGTPVAGNGQIGVAFTPIASSPPATYTASCSSSDGGNPGTLGGSASPITVTGLTNGRTYQCSVTATVNGLTSPASGPSSAVIPRADLPGTPTITGVTRHDRSVTVAFSAPTDPGFSPVTSYSASCPSTTGGATGSQTGTVSPINVAGLTNGATYTCTVTAHNAAGAGAPSALSATFVPATVPGAPGDMVAKARDSSAIVSWSAPGNGGSAITAYLVTYTPGDKSVTVDGSTTGITIPGLHNGNAYSFTVRARNDVGTGPPSAEAGPVVPNLLDINGEVIEAAPNGYWFVTADGKVASFGEAKNFGGLTRLPNAFVIGIEPTPTMKGYWLVASDGGIFAFGDAAFRGSTGNLTLNRPIIGMASTASGKGYWLVASDGGIFSFGDAKFYGSTGGIRLNQPIVGMTASPSGEGYWLVASDGGIFAFGDAKFYGSAGGIKLNKPIVAMDHTPSGRGYWMVATDGGVFSFGEAPFYGSTGAIHLNRPIIGMSATPTGKGYWFVAADAGLFSFGDAPFYGPALGAQSFFVAHPVTAMNASRAGG
ncbi:MAG: fibronectin type III domain-containing protein [Acidimicrobiia bacterium]